ncbi:unnamed protein product [Orchesella dallaii]|uniref:Uncharacterized protein n=1 Tax=Orchesella dallaii TaxID=48710 RepID=A0ABP1PXV1_9HEXA
MRPLARIYFSSILTNVGFVLLIFCVRALQAVIFFRVIGKDSMSLPVIIVNHAVNDAGDPYNDPANTTHLPCSLWNMSCEFVKPHDEILSMSVCRNENKTEVEARKMWGYIVIPRNFRKNCAAWKGHESYGKVTRELLEKVGWCVRDMRWYRYAGVGDRVQYGRGLRRNILDTDK